MGLEKKQIKNLIDMEKMTEKYVAPEVLVVECQVEKGFATTGDTFSLGVQEEIETGTASSRGWSHGW